MICHYIYFYLQPKCIFHRNSRPVYPVYLNASTSSNIILSPIIASAITIRNTTRISVDWFGGNIRQHMFDNNTCPTADATLFTNVWVVNLRLLLTTSSTSLLVAFIHFVLPHSKLNQRSRFLQCYTHVRSLQVSF